MFGFVGLFGLGFVVVFVLGWVGGWFWVCFRLLVVEVAGGFVLDGFVCWVVWW